jgi:tetratricopeptide (TPR) repeat protein
MCVWGGACAGAPPSDEEAPRAAPEPPRRRRADGVLGRAAAALARDDVAAAKKILEEDRWLAEDRAGAALLLAGCLLLEGDHARAVDVLREYLARTTRLKTEGDVIAVRLLRHHGSGGGLAARSAREACHFGLYALGALQEPAAARPDLERALRDAPEAEQHLARVALARAGSPPSSGACGTGPS